MRAPFVSVVFLAVAVSGAASSAVAAERLCDSAFEDCRRPLLDLIANEDVGLDVAFWFMEDSRYANAIIARWNAGVPVRVVVDTKANTAYPGNVRMLQMLKDAGIPMRQKTSDYLHWKMMLFVGQNTVEFSGANYSPNAFVPNEPYVDYVDEVIYFTDDPAVVNSFKKKYDDVWVSTSGYKNYANITTPLTRNHATYPLDPNMNFPPTQNFATRSAGRYNAEDAGIDSIIYRIDDARHTNAILAAVGRGVPVRLITEQEQYRDPVRLWHSYNVDRLYKGGVQVKFRGHQGLAHEKLTLLHEQRMTILGSSNWTVSSAASQLEHNYFTTKSWMYAWARDHFERKWNNLGPAIETKPFVPLPPDTPGYRLPANASQGLGTSVQLRWYGGPWAHVYDVYLGTDPNDLQLHSANLSLGPSATTTTFQNHPVTGLQPSTTYYWRIVSKTAADLSRTGPVWTFRTAGGLPSAGAGDVVLYAGRATRTGRWAATADATAAGGVRMWNQNASLAKVTAPVAAPADYFEMSFSADAGVPYRLWVRGKADSNSWGNDSVYVQFSDSVTSAGAAVYRIGSTSGTAVTIEECSGCGLSGWGWADNAYGADGPRIYFRDSGTHTIRVQRREDGISIDQIVLSRSVYLDQSPGHAKDDGTILQESGGTVGEEPPPPPPPPPASLPNGWLGTDIGAVGQEGSASASGGTFTVTGAGADVWGTADAFHYAYRTLDGDGRIVARVATLSGSQAWTKVGVMIRATLAANSAHASMFVSKSKGLAFQRRTAAGGLSTHTSGPAGTAPQWVRLTRTGNLVVADVSSDGSTWTVVDSATIALDQTALIGLAVTAHSTTSTATGTFDNVVITP
jgi:HKD family nuclease/regulation of enolase protein 1 (concanavalin A-like superfamily)